MLSKKQRLVIFLDPLASAPAASSEGEARVLLKELLNQVEDEFSGIPFNPLLPTSNGRMYAPRDDNRRAVPGQQLLNRFRSAAHNTYFGKNGSIRIETLEKEVLLDKPGADGRRTIDLTA